MRKTILTYGFIAGAILAGVMLATYPFMDTAGYPGALIGYTSMLLAFLLVYFGVRSYRDNVAGGRITFGRAFLVGIAITAVASACYVATWEFIYFRLAPDFADRYAAHEVAQARAHGVSEAEVAKKQQELEAWAKMYRNPLVNIAQTFLEPLPVGLLLTLVAAFVLKKREPLPVPVTAN